MSRSLPDLRRELQEKGTVSIPPVTARNIASSMSVALVPAAFAFLILWRADLGTGPLIAIISFLAAALIIVAWSIRDLRKRVIVTPTDLHLPGERSLGWREIETVGVPAARSILRIQVTCEGFLSRNGETHSSLDDPDFLDSAEDRAITWPLSGDISETELRLLREQIQPKH